LPFSPASDQHGLAREQRVAEDRQPSVAQRRPGRHDVRDRVRDVEPYRRFHRAVQPDHLSGDALRVQVGLDHPGVRGRDPLSREILHRLGCSWPGGEAEGRAGEAERQDRLGRGRRVEEQVLAGDTDVEASRSDIDRDVARSQVEELGVVVGIDEDEFTGVRALPVTGLAQHLDRGLGQRSLVGNSNA
jgi:hypothetical protein